MGTLGRKRWRKPCTSSPQRRAVGQSEKMSGRVGYANAKRAYVDTDVCGLGKLARPVDGADGLANHDGVDGDLHGCRR